MAMLVIEAWSKKSSTTLTSNILKIWQHIWIVKSCSTRATSSTHTTDLMSPSSIWSMISDSKSITLLKAWNSNSNLKLRTSQQSATNCQSNMISNMVACRNILTLISWGRLLGMPPARESLIGCSTIGGMSMFSNFMQVIWSMQLLVSRTRDPIRLWEPPANGITPS